MGDLEQSRRFVDSLARDDIHPHVSDLINTVSDALDRIDTQASPLNQLAIIEAVFTGLTYADIFGYINVGDEHEWATVAKRARERQR
jgi:hypothetical protein